MIERLAVVLEALELTLEELAEVVVEDCRNRAPATDWDAVETRVALARLIVPDGWGVCPHDHPAQDRACQFDVSVSKGSVPQQRPIPMGRPPRCGAVSALALGPVVCRRVEGHEGAHSDAGTSWAED